MANIFNSKPGQVSIVDSPSGAPGSMSFKVEGWPTTKAVIINSIGYDQNVNVQFLPTLRKMTYIYSFGDNMGRITISGVAFDSVCKTKVFGVKEMIEYYNKNRAVEDRTVKIFVGGEVITGFLVKSRIVTQNIELKLTGFSLDLAALPQGE